MKTADNPLNTKPAFPNAAQCAATSKRTRCRCRAPAVTGWKVCRFHGAKGGAHSGSANGRYRHGRDTKEAMQEMAHFRELVHEAQELLDVIG